MDSEEKTAHQVRRLQASVRDLQNALRLASKMEFTSRPPKLMLSFSSLELNETNPYGRILANNDRGVVHGIERLQSIGVMVVGLNGLGALTAEAFSRYGVKKLLLIDNAPVTMADLDYMHYKASDVGRKREDQVAAHLLAVNPDVDVLTANLSLRVPVELVSALRSKLLPPQHSDSSDDDDDDDNDDIDSDDGGNGPNQGRGVRLSRLTHDDLNVVFLCVADGDLAILLNELCCELGLRFVYVFVRPNGITGEVVSVIPGRSSCIQCFEKRKLFKTSLVSNDDSAAELGIRLVEASLPTTECILSGLSIHNTVMDMLGFGSFCSRLEYDGYLEELERSGFLAPVHQCPSTFCRQQQQKYAKPVPAPAPVVPGTAPSSPVPPKRNA